MTDAQTVVFLKVLREIAQSLKKLAEAQAEFVVAQKGDVGDGGPGLRG